MQENTEEREPKSGDTYHMSGTKGVTTKEVSKSPRKTSSDGSALYHVTYEHKLPRKNGVQKVNVEAHKKEFSPKSD